MPHKFTAWLKSEWNNADPLVQAIGRLSFSLIAIVLIACLIYFPPLAWKGYRAAHFPAPVTVRTLDEVKQIRDGFKKRGINSCAVIVKYRAGEPEEYAVVAGR